MVNGADQGSVQAKTSQGQQYSTVARTTNALVHYADHDHAHANDRHLEHDPDHDPDLDRGHGCGQEVARGHACGHGRHRVHRCQRLLWAA